MFDIYTLEDGITQLKVIPALGGAIASWQRLADSLPLLRPMPILTDTTTARQLGAFLLIPWSNRIAQRGIDTPQGWIELPNNTDQPFAMHGSTWQQAWQVKAFSDNELVLYCEPTLPIHIQVTQTIRLQAGSLTIEVNTCHVDKRPFWHGYGWHPFFPRTPHTQLITELTAMWVRDEQGLSVKETVLPHEMKFHKEQILPTQMYDHVFSGWQGNYTIQQPELDYQLTVSANPMDYLIIYTPTHHEFFCVEPVSHPINAHHLPEKNGLKLLSQGEALHWQVSIEYQAF